MSAQRVWPWVALAWAVVVGVFVAAGVRHGEITAKEQATVAQALPTVDRTVADLAAALDPAMTVLAIGPYELVTEGCRITPVRSGNRYQRVLTAYPAAGSEAGLLASVAGNLPEHYATSVTDQVLRVDAGDFVTARGEASRPGKLRFVVDAGCRPGRLSVRGPAPEDSPQDVRQQVTTVIDVLGGTAAKQAARRLDCPGAGVGWTYRTLLRGARALDALADRVGGATVVVARSDLLAYRVGPVEVAVHRSGDSTSVEATVRCQH